jgi:hypothetical protein
LRYGRAKGERTEGSHAVRSSPAAQPVGVSLKVEVVGMVGVPL